ncbi:MAG: hypothetical protein ACYCQI_16240 [Gammaproteobacteria bacterium]
MLGVDDFWFAHWIHRYQDHIPYRDFSPYKTVLGYYFLLIPMSQGTDFIAPLFYTKNTLAVLNAVLFFISGLWLKRFFSSTATLTTIALLVCTEFVLSYSTNIRVDLLSYWFCFFSVMLLLEKRYLWAGAMLAVGFMTSQKVLWYIVASNAALGMCWLVFARDWKGLRDIVLFNLALVLLVLAYIGFWSYFSSSHTVLHNMFYEAYIMYQLDVYNSARKLFWGSTLIYNPLLFLLWPLTLLSLIIKLKHDTEYQLRFFCLIYATVILACLIPYKQIFPYYMLTTVPAFLLGFTAFFSWCYAIFKEKNLSKSNPYSAWLFVFFYLVGLVYCFFSFHLPMIYSLIFLIPLLLGFYITGQPQRLIMKNRSALPNLILLIALFVGFIYPLIIFFTFVVTNTKNSYQQSILKLTHALLQTGGDYVAGIELFYDKNQPIAGMRHLDAALLSYLYHPSDKIRSAMLASLYRTPNATQASTIEELENSSVKLYVNNYRMHALPPRMLDFLHKEYEHFWGSVYLYAPTIPAGKHLKQIKFSGRYLIESKNPVSINGKRFNSMSIINLTQGKSWLESSTTFRLKLIPENIKNQLDPQFADDQWNKVLG